MVQKHSPGQRRNITLKIQTITIQESAGLDAGKNNRQEFDSRLLIYDKRLNALRRFSGWLLFSYRPELPLNPQRISIAYLAASWLPSFSAWIAASALPCFRRRSTHSPKNATRGCFPWTALAVVSMRFSKLWKNRVESNMPLAIHYESASAASTTMYLPCLRAAATSTPLASKL